MTKYLFLFLALLAGCATFQSTTQGVLVTTGQGVTQVDQAFAPEYRDASLEALEASQSLKEYEARMEPWNRAEEALRGVYEALLAAEAALNAYVAGSEGNVVRAVLALVQVLRHLAEALEPVLPEEVDQVIQLVGGVLDFLGQASGDER